MISEFGVQHIERAVWGKEETNCLLESNTLLLGATQTGKSTLADIMINQVHETNKGKIVILEVKGERIKDIDDSDFVVSCSMSKDKKGKEFVWSVLREATASGNANVEEKLARIYEPIFKEKLQKSTQPYFINAAFNLLVGITYAMYLKYGVVSNRYLFQTIEEMDLADYYNILAETKIIKRYARDLPIINGKMSGQTAGVLGEFSHYIRLFSRIFKSDGMDSIYDYCSSLESEKIYFLYDYNSREECNILYSILLNQVIAYKLSYYPITHQRVYMFLDEISVIDNAQIDLQYAANIGTSKGLHLILAIQSIQFLMAIYGEASANAILEGFNNIVAFKVNQEDSKIFIRSRTGMEQEVMLMSMPISRRDKATYQIKSYNNITDELIDGLDTGDAIVKVGIKKTTIVHFRRGE